MQKNLRKILKKVLTRYISCAIIHNVKGRCRQKSPGQKEVRIMKKVTVNENTEIYEFCGSEEGRTYTLYVGVEPVYGEWILTTEGNPVALNDLEEEGSKGSEETIAKIEAIIGAPEPLGKNVKGATSSISMIRWKCGGLKNEALRKLRKTIVRAAGVLLLPAMRY